MRSPADDTKRGNFLEVLAVFTKLGLTLFGGPVAHLGYFWDEIVERRRWLDDQSYADLVALCQFLPGQLANGHRAGHRSRRDTGRLCRVTGLHAALSGCLRTEGSPRRLTPAAFMRLTSASTAQPLLIALSVHPKELRFNFHHDQATQ